MRWLLGLLCCWGCITGAYASDKPTYYIAVNDADFLPYSWIDEGVLRGADRAILDAFGKQQQLHLVYLPLPRLRALELMRAGTVDLIYPDDTYWTFGAKQGMAMQYSNYGITNQTGFFRFAETKCAENFTSIGTLLGWMPDGYQEKIAAGQVELQRFASLEQMLEAGQKQQVGALFSERQFLESYIEREPRYQQLEFCDKLPSSIGKFRLSTLEHPEVLEQFNAFLKASPEVVTQIRERYRLP